MTCKTEKRHSPQATPFPENNLCCFMSAALGAGIFLFLFSSIEKRKSFFTPQRGVFFSSWKRGKRLRPTFLFLLREKKKRAAPGTKKKSAGSGFRDESCSFFLCALRPDSGCLGAVRTGFTFCAAAANGCGKGSFSVVRN